MKKRIFVLATLLSLSLLLSGCGAKPLPDGMEEATAGEAGRTIVTLLNEGDYQSVVDQFQPEFREEYGVTADKIAEIMTAIAPAGEFVQFERTLAIGGQSKSYDGDYASVIVYANHAEDNVVYELSFTPDLTLMGLSVKHK